MIRKLILLLAVAIFFMQSACAPPALTQGLIDGLNEAWSSTNKRKEAPPIPKRLKGTATPVPRDIFWEYVKEVMDDYNPTGFSAEYFKIGDFKDLRQQANFWLHGVYVDQYYMDSKPWFEKSGPEGVTEEEDQVIILRSDPKYSPKGRQTAFHEAIHAAHLAMASSVDYPKGSGKSVTDMPEQVNTLGGLLVLVKRLDKRLQDVARSPSPQAVKALKVVANRMVSQLRDFQNGEIADHGTAFYEVLRNIKGYARFNRYYVALAARIEELERQAARGSALPIGSRLAPSIQSPFLAVPRTMELEGIWKREDGAQERFRKQGDDYIGYAEALTNLLAKCGFKVGETTFKVKRISENQFTGRVLWKWASGRSEWRSVKITVTGDRMSDSSTGNWIRVGH